MTETSPVKTKFSAMTQWAWMSLALVVFLIFGISTVLLQKQLRENQETRGQADTETDTAYITKGKSSLTAGNESYFELDLNTHGQPMDRIYLEFDVLGDANFMTVTSESLGGFSLQNTDLKILDSQVTPITTPTSDGKVGWHVSAGIASVNFPNATFSLTTPTPVLRFALVAPTSGPVMVVFDQARTNPYISPSPSPAQVFIPVMIFDVAQVSCTYDYSDWSACNAGVQTRSVTVSPDTCAAPDDAELTRACLPQCVYAYSDWTACSNGWQTRTYSATPEQCTWYETEVLKPLTQQCNEVVSTKDLSTYTYEACWNEQSNGASTYVIWDKTKFPNVTKVDVSTSNNFSGYANKDVTNATSTLNGNYLATDGTNFRTADDRNALWVFWPGYTYYFRLFYGDGIHSGVISYYVPKCAGVGGVSYKQCNESCTANKDCAANLSCVSGQCRRSDNSSSSICAASPDRGLNRSCNEYCADNRECGSGYTCWWNRCRLPNNLDDVSCRTATRRTTTPANYYQAKGGTNYVVAGSEDSAPSNITPEMSCNDTCRTNRDCAAGLRCYQSNCRLPENVTNASCQSLAEAKASTAAAAVRPTLEPTTETTTGLTAPVVDETLSQANWWTNLAEWLAGRLGFVVLGLLVAVFIILIWPLLRPSSIRSMPARPISQTPVTPSTGNTTTTGPSGLNRLPPMPQSTSGTPATPVNQMFKPTQPASPPTQPVQPNQPQTGQNRPFNQPPTGS